MRTGSAVKTRQIDTILLGRNKKHGRPGDNDLTAAGNTSVAFTASSQINRRAVASTKSAMFFYQGGKPWRPNFTTFSCSRSTPLLIGTAPLFL